MARAGEEGEERRGRDDGPGERERDDDDDLGAGMR
jgi:hypothetical protein